MPDTQKLHRFLLWGLALLLLMTAGADAALGKKSKKKKKLDNEAEVQGYVVNMQDEPVAKARITVTAVERPDLKIEAVSDDKGVFTVLVEEPAGLEYNFHLEAEGYAAFDGKMPLHENERAEINFKVLDVETGRRQEAVKAFNAGVRAFDAEDYGTALAKFQEAIELDPDVPQPHLGLAEVHYRQENLEDAAREIEIYLKAVPDDVSALTLAYTVNRQLGNTERTSELTDALAKTDKAPALARQVYNEGVAALQSGDNDAAAAKFERAAGLDGNLKQALSALATIRYNQARYEDAEAAIEKLFAADPEDKQGRRIRYLIYDALDDQEKAGPAFDSYMEVDPDGALDVLYQRAELDFREGRTDAAVTALRKILEQRPEMPRAHYTLGLCLTQSDPAQAKIHLNKFLELAPDDPEVASAKEMLSYL